MNAINRQVGGDHYKRYFYQPFQLSMDINASPGFTLMVRYLTRDKEDRLQDVEKCKHIVELEQEWATNYPKQFNDVYNAALEEQEERLIAMFSSQFGEEQALYYSILRSMHTHQYDEVIDLLEEVK